MKINEHDNSPVGIFSRRNTVYNCTNRTLLELPTSGRDNCQSWCRELADFRYRNVRHHRRPIASRINRQQYESRKRDISRYIVTTNFLQEDRGIYKNADDRTIFILLNIINFLEIGCALILPLLPYMWNSLNNLESSSISRTRSQFDWELYPPSFQDNIQHRFAVIGESLKECKFLIIEKWKSKSTINTEL